MHHYCTYFDSRYLSRGLALLGSLERHARPFRLWVLCLDAATEGCLNALQLDYLVAVGLPQLEAADPELLATRASRSLIEYYFTSTPCWIRYVHERLPQGADLTYLDADLYFFSDP